MQCVYLTNIFKLDKTWRMDVWSLQLSLFQVKSRFEAFCSHILSLFFISNLLHLFHLSTLIYSHKYYFSSFICVPPLHFNSLSQVFLLLLYLFHLSTLIQPHNSSSNIYTLKQAYSHKWRIFYFILFYFSEKLLSWVLFQFNY